MKSNILSNLKSLGISFSVKSIDFSSQIITPEDAILSALPILKDDKLVLQLLLTWIKHHSELIHVESLVKKLKYKKEPIELAFMAALLASSENRRLISVAEKCSYSKKNLDHQVGKTLSLAAKLGQVEYDSVFLKYGLRVSKLYEEKQKKFLPQEYMIKGNPFLFCRTLFGSNWRADVAAVLLIQKMNPTELARVLDCSYETAYRNSRTLQVVGWPEVEFAEIAV